MKYYHSLILFMLLFSLGGCSTFSQKEFEGLDENQLFNKIQIMQQNAISPKQYKKIIACYQYYITTHEERRDRVMEARYEIAYINYYLKNYDSAQNDFRSIINEYENGGSSYTMQWIYVLCVKLRDEITNIKKAEILKKEQKELKRQERAKKAYQ